MNTQRQAEALPFQDRIWRWAIPKENREAKIVCLRHRHFSVGEQVLFHKQGQQTGASKHSSVRDSLLSQAAKSRSSLNFLHSNFYFALSSHLILTSFSQDLLWDYTLNLSFKSTYWSSDATNLCILSGTNTCSGSNSNQVINLYFNFKHMNLKSLVIKETHAHVFIFTPSNC